MNELKIKNFSNHAIFRFYERVRPDLLKDATEVFERCGVELNENNLAVYVRTSDMRVKTIERRCSAKYIKELYIRAEETEKFHNMNDGRPTDYFLFGFLGKQFVFVVRDNTVVTILDYSKRDFHKTAPNNLKNLC